MTDKAYYQAAAAEVASGQFDSALWIKINADMPEATQISKQARYIQLRADELARATRHEATRNAISSRVSTINRRIMKTAIWVCGLGVVFMMFTSVFDKYQSLAYKYHTIASNAALYPILINDLNTEKKERDADYNNVMRLGKDYQFSNGQTVGDRWEIDKGQVVSAGSMAMKSAVDIQSGCFDLPKERASFLGGLVDPIVRNPAVDPICAQWLSSTSPLYEANW